MGKTQGCRNAGAAMRKLQDESAVVLHVLITVANHS